MEGGAGALGVGMEGGAEVMAQEWGEGLGGGRRALELQSITVAPHES